MEKSFKFGCNIPPSRGADIKLKGLYFDSMTLLT